MKREDKNAQTRQNILDAALKEFSTKGYEKASLNTICQTGSMSKGIIYHYFDSKDGLYLAVVEEAFRRLTDYLKSSINLSSDNLLDQYFEARVSFFRAHKDDAAVVFDATVLPPEQLINETNEKRQSFDALNDAYLIRIIRANKVRPDLTEDEILRVFHQFNQFFHAGYRNQGRSAPDIKAHEKDCQNALDIFFYGIIERK